jgi:hypothetical protein
MARIIKKKVISEDLLFSDDFDENALDQIEGKLDDSTTPVLPEERVLDLRADQPKSGGAKRRSGEPARPDEEEDPSESIHVAAFDKSGEDSKQEGHTEPASGSKPQIVGKKTKWSGRTLLSTAAFVLLILTAGLIYLLYPHAENDASRTHIVRRPIVIPKHEREVSFLILASTPERSDLLKLDLEFDFISLNGYEKFTEKQNLYHDFIYSFLIKQQLPDNSVQNWEKILEEELLTSLKTDCPEIRLSSIRVKNFHRL